MDAPAPPPPPPSNHDVSCCVPYLALKRVAGSDRPVLYNVFSAEKKVGVEDGSELTNTNCWATPQGWILVRDAPSSTTYLLDPHGDPSDTGRRIPLPHLPDVNLLSHCSCLLSDYPSHPSGQTTTSSSSNCIVLLVETDDPVIWYCRIGDSEWVRHEYDIGTLDNGIYGGIEKLVICPIAACRGKFYFNGCSFDEIGVLEFSPAPVFSSIVINNNTMAEPVGFRKAFLVESMQELYMVCLLSGLDLDMVHRFSVHKMDFDKDEWHQVDDIGDRVFLLSSWYFGASRSADECGLERNCVYVVYPWNQHMMIFNLTDRTAEVQDLDGAPASNQALWMLPTHP